MDATLRLSFRHPLNPVNHTFDLQLCLDDLCPDRHRLLFDAAQNGEFPCLSPLAVMREMEEFVKHVTEYEFLKQDIKDGFHDSIAACSRQLPV